VGRSIASRQQAVVLGEQAEAFVAARLVEDGVSILARRWRARGGEVDLIARRDAALRFVEVKARSGDGDGLSSISWDKQRRIARAARAWLDRHDPGVDDIAFLVALVDCREDPWRVVWMDDAFDGP